MLLRMTPEVAFWPPYVFVRTDMHTHARTHKLKGVILKEDEILVKDLHRAVDQG